MSGANTDPGLTTQDSDKRIFQDTFYRASAGAHSSQDSRKSNERQLLKTSLKAQLQHN